MPHSMRVRLSAIAAVVFLVAVLVASGLVFDRQKSLYHRDIDTVTWSLYQFDRSVRDLRMAIWEQGSDGLNAILLDFELLYGRLRSLEEGQTADSLKADPGTAQVAQRIIESMHRLDEVFLALSEGDVTLDAAVAKRLTDQLGRLQAMSRELMRDHGARSAEVRSGDMVELSRLYLLVLAAMALTLVAGGVLIHAVVRESRGRRRKSLLLESQSSALREAVHRAEAASRAKSDFMAIMSHEIRTPLNGVLGMADLLRDEALSEQGRRHVEGLEESANGLRAVINDVLDYTRIETGHLAVECQPFSLPRMIEQLSMGYQTQPLSGVQFLLRAAPELPCWVAGDSHRLRQVLMNLLNNAFKFTEHGFVMLRVSKSEGDRISFVVYDTGSGIDEKDLTRIFEPFAQTDTTLARRHEGAGLGLAICARLVTAMGGELRVESQPGSGSRFWFEIPLPVGVEPSGEGSGEQEGSDNIEAHQVLVVEDNALNRELVAVMLARLGQRCELVGNGEQALEALGRRDFDLVLMDMQMPVMDGLETTRRWREREAQLATIAGAGVSRLPIVAVTANVMPDHREACLAAGMEDLLGKPFSRSDLRRVLKRYPARVLATQGRDLEAAVDASERQGAVVGDSLQRQDWRKAMDEDLLSPTTLNELRSLMSPPGLNRLVSSYLQRLPVRAQRLREALDLDDRESLGLEAHDLKGISASLGCVAIEACMAELEQQASGGPDTRLRQILDSLERLAPATGKALRDVGMVWS
ncbi:ATP-binding protein [Halomonas sp. V046]|uniref:ATP-binding protein n=1 Tax=Halomonas sp. V046 TaxID=3459611 RepID=UPI004044A15E